MSKTFKEEFLANYNARESSKEFRKLLQNIPEGVVLFDENTSNINFVNFEMKNTLDVYSYVKTQEKIQELEDLKFDIGLSFESKNMKVNNIDEITSWEAFKRIHNWFRIRNHSDKTFESIRTVYHDKEFNIEEHSLRIWDFLRFERQKCQEENKNINETKVSMFLSDINLGSKVELLERDFVIKTWRIGLDNATNK